MRRPLRFPRPPVLLTLVLGLVLLTSACSGLTGGSGAGSAGPGQQAVIDASESRVEVPSKPKRVVVLSQRDLEAALALGVRPVGLVSEGGAAELSDYLADQLGPKPTIVGAPDDLEPARIAKLKPDLILAGSLSKKKVLERLRKITPATVVTTKPTEPWTSTFDRIALILGKQGKGKAVLEVYDKKVKAARKALDSYAGAAASIVQWDPEEPRYVQRDALASLVLRDLGFTRPETQQRPGGVSVSDPLDPEELKPLDAELMFLFSTDPEVEKALAKAKKSSDFRQLSVVRRDNVVNVDAEVWTSAGGPLAADLVIDAVLEGLGKSIEPEDEEPEDSEKQGSDKSNSSPPEQSGE